MSYNIITSDPFEKELKYLAKKYPSAKSDVAELVLNFLRILNLECPLEMIVIKYVLPLLLKAKANLEEQG